MLGLFGLWEHPSVVQMHQETPRQSAAQGLVITMTVLILTVLDVDHAPAAATALFASSGISRPGLPLLGLVVGLVAVIVLARLLSRLVPRPAHPGDGRSRGRPQHP